ncbi:hypothetical protein TVAG_021250 [Trichomonas vaginalis G3]|uniref:Uncharacterized protein n=1 Tax=Trichomonas vaginalis (strain ATCC PRA-98 / G3) TaxID=412133 RepID=A2DHA7_TRIV3|nr:factor VIII-associated gene 1 family protein [Trichomonas vaginalis G3]EAY20180.1 hypothetical protein TVAG_021250 [Trichomonas vaginalis G3]KAI5507660.1 factor VIII-associated gene 1 family protein [Trichomonas vaginalis G3]|eukprot:XP_001581166.1 hypothetical protein [Trichomonas vaginalis G3]
MFYKQWDELSAKLNSSFNSKKSIMELAQQFYELGKRQDIENPFEQGMIALATFGEMQCYEKLQDKQNTIQTAITAARLFIKSATFNYEVSRTIRDLWSDPLADGIHCFRVAYKTLILDGKPNLAVAILLELAKTESYFEYHHYAGNTYEEVIQLCIDKNLRPRAIVDSTFSCVLSYVKAERYDLGLIAVTKTIEKLKQTFQQIISSSPLMRQQFDYLLILRGQMLFCNNKNEECLQFLDEEKFDSKVREFFAKFLSQANLKNVESMEQFIGESKNLHVFNDVNFEIFNIYKDRISKPERH